jgi:hypothetical protein
MFFSVYGISGFLGNITAYAFFRTRVFSDDIVYLSMAGAAAVGLGFLLFVRSPKPSRLTGFLGDSFLLKIDGEGDYLDYNYRNNDNSNDSDSRVFSVSQVKYI